MPHSRITHITAVAALGLLGALAVAACGGSHKPSGASAGAGPPTKSFASSSAHADRYSRCMRGHGVTNFPDPEVHSSGGHQSLAIAINPSIVSSPAFASAQKACAHLMPGMQASPNGGSSAAQQRRQTEAMLAFAKCMRGHGFPRFPDPTAQGQLSLQAIQSAGIDLTEPAVKPAADACTKVTHGVVTKADVAQAIANPSGASSTHAQGTG